MVKNSEEGIVTLSEKARERLTKAKREEESLSDVIIRLSDTKIDALQNRGEKEITTSDEKKLLVRIIQSKCMGAESSVMVAPPVFSLDVKQLGVFRRGKEPLGVKNVAESTIDSETIVLAAKSCPYKAIYVKDTGTGEELAGDPW